MNRSRQVGRVGVEGDDLDALGHGGLFSVGQSAVGSLADTMRAFAPLLIAAWMAGICEAGVACGAAGLGAGARRAPQRGERPAGFTLSAVVK